MNGGSPLTRRHCGEKENDFEPAGGVQAPEASTVPSNTKRHWQHDPAKNNRSSVSCICCFVVLSCFGLYILGFLSPRSLVASNILSWYFQQSDAGFPSEESLTLTNGKKPTECGIWVAPSSLRPFPGFGIFTTRDISRRESILGAPDSVTIQYRDGKRRRNMPLEKARRTMWKTWSAYVWNQGVPDHDRYFWPQDTVDIQPGIGELPNHHCILSSLGFDFSPYDDEVVNRDTSPGLGAITYTLGRDFRATRDLKAGDEIFLDYGMCKRDPEDGYDFEWGEFIYMPEDFTEAARIVKLHQPFSPTPWPRDNITLAKLVDTSSNANARFVSELLPHTDAARKRLFAAVNAHAFDDDAGDGALLEALAKGVLVERSPAWIKQNGVCLENLAPKKSVLPDAGYGGFAQFGVRKGEIVVPAPVLHVVDKEIMTIYETGVDVMQDPERYKVGTQVMLNYCFGHPESSMLLCPMTSATLINHCSMRTKECGPDGPNAEVRWSSGWDPTSVPWRSKTFEEIDEHKGRILSFEIVATRNISPGEEVFIDYGLEWENAWNAHKRRWTPPHKGDNFISASEANKRDGPVVESLVSGDLRMGVDHPYLFTGCAYQADDKDLHGVNFTKPNPTWTNMTDKEILETYSRGGKRFFREYGYLHHRSRSHWPCTVIFPESEVGEYTVRIHQTPMRGTYKGKNIVTTSWHKNDVPLFLKNYPQTSIHYFVKPTATDQMLPGAFRHPIGFPDELFPQQWRRKQST